MACDQIAALHVMHPRADSPLMPFQRAKRPQSINSDPATRLTSVSPTRMTFSLKEWTSPASRTNQVREPKKTPATSIRPETGWPTMCLTPMTANAAAKAKSVRGLVNTSRAVEKKVHVWLPGAFIPLSASEWGRKAAYPIASRMIPPTRRIQYCSRGNEVGDERDPEGCDDAADHITGCSAHPDHKAVPRTVFERAPDSADADRSNRRRQRKPNDSTLHKIHEVHAVESPELVCLPVRVIDDRGREVQECGNSAQVRETGSDLLAVQQ